MNYKLQVLSEDCKAAKERGECAASLNDKHYVSLYLFSQHMKRQKNEVPGMNHLQNQLHLCIHDKSMSMTIVEICHLIAELPAFKEDKVHPYTILNCFRRMAKVGEIGNDHYFKMHPNSSRRRVSNAKYGYIGIPFCSKYHSEALTKDQIKNALEKAKRYCPFWNSTGYEDFDKRYEKAESAGPDAFPAGINADNIEFKVVESCWTKCQRNVRGKKCFGEMYFPIESHEGIHFTIMRCRKCDRKDAFYCKICDNAFTSRFRHRHLDHFDKLLTETPMLCTLCLESNTPERHGSVLQFEDEDVSVEDAENGNILICKNALCEEQMKKMTIYKDAKKVDRKCDRHKIVWCDIGKHYKVMPVIDGELVEKVWNDHLVKCKKDFAPKGTIEYKGHWKYYTDLTKCLTVPKKRKLSNLERERDSPRKEQTNSASSKREKTDPNTNRPRRSSRLNPDLLEVHDNDLEAVDNMNNDISKVVSQDGSENEEEIASNSNRGRNKSGSDEDTEGTIYITQKFVDAIKGYVKSKTRKAKSEIITSLCQKIDKIEAENAAEIAEIKSECIEYIEEALEKVTNVILNGFQSPTNGIPAIVSEHVEREVKIQMQPLMRQMEQMQAFKRQMEESLFDNSPSVQSMDEESEEERQMEESLFDNSPSVQSMDEESEEEEEITQSVAAASTKTSSKSKRRIAITREEWEAGKQVRFSDFAKSPSKGSKKKGHKDDNDDPFDLLDMMNQF